MIIIELIQWDLVYSNTHYIYIFHHVQNVLYIKRERERERERESWGYEKIPRVEILELRWWSSDSREFESGMSGCSAVIEVRNEEKEKRKKRQRSFLAAITEDETWDTVVSLRFVSCRVSKFNSRISISTTHFHSVRMRMRVRERHTHTDLYGSDGSGSLFTSQFGSDFITIIINYYLILISIFFFFFTN